MRSVTFFVLWATAQSYSIRSPQQPAPPAFTAIEPDTATSRRGLLRKLWKTAAVSTFLSTTATTANVQPALASSNEEKVYFGVGCFWHTQFSFVDAERRFLGRNDKELTSLAGYAGGKSTDSQGRVCYHNFQSIADYGKLGHSEVVGMSLPTDKIPDFAEFYFALFDPRTKGVCLLSVCVGNCCRSEKVIHF